MTNFISVHCLLFIIYNISPNTNKYNYISSLFKDIKPYIPFDVISSDYTLPMARKSDGSVLVSRKLKVPNWIVDSDIPMLPVTFHMSACEEIESIARDGRLRCCEDAAAFLELATQGMYRINMNSD